VVKDEFLRIIRPVLVWFKLTYFPRS